MAAMAAMADSWQFLAIIIGSGSHIFIADHQIFQICGNISPLSCNWRSFLLIMSNSTSYSLINVGIKQTVFHSGSEYTEAKASKDN